MAVDLLGYVYYDNGNPVTTATVEVYNQVPALVTSGSTNASGQWSFSGLTDGVTYDVKVIVGSVVRWIKGGEKHQVASIVYFAVPYLEYVEQSSAPSAPAAGNSRVYLKTDHRLYAKDSGGNETAIGSDVLAAQVFGR